MNTEDLKTGFWGYKKYSVYQYISEMETQFSAKLLEKDEEAKALLEQERQRSRQLEAELEKLHKQLDRQQEEQALIASTLMEAKRYAQQLKDQAEEQQKAAQQQLEEALISRDAELKLYDSRLQELRQQFKNIPAQEFYRAGKTVQCCIFFCLMYGKFRSIHSGDFFCSGNSGI